MLWSPAWDTPKTQPRTFAAWLDAHDTPYDWRSCQDCAIARYLRERGIGVLGVHAGEVRIWDPDIPESERSPLTDILAVPIPDEWNRLSKAKSVSSP